MPRPTLFLIDGSSQMYRAYHAFRGRGLSNQEGHTTHAVYVFVTMLRKLIADHKPAYMAASFDLAGPTFRDEIVEDYKANRVAMPDDRKHVFALVVKRSCRCEHYRVVAGSRRRTETTLSCRAAAS